MPSSDPIQLVDLLASPEQMYHGDGIGICCPRNLPGTGVDTQRSTEVFVCQLCEPGIAMVHSCILAISGGSFSLKNN